MLNKRSVFCKSQKAKTSIMKISKSKFKIFGKYLRRTSAESPNTNKNMGNEKGNISGSMFLNLCSKYCICSFAKQ